MHLIVCQATKQTNIRSCKITVFNTARNPTLKSIN